MKALTRHAPDFYVVGGTLHHDAPSYIERRADQELFESLLRGEYSYVLTSRQMGKSSLMTRTAARLRAAGIGVAVLILTAVGQNLTIEQWYVGLLLQIGQRLDMEDEALAFWRAHPELGPLQRWLEAICQVVLPHYLPAGRLVICLDEIDAVRSLPFSTDEFFAGIRECYNQRSTDAALEHLSFCLLGVAAPTDLIRDTRTTPFNIGRRIELHDFLPTEAAPLAHGLGREPGESAHLLQRILYWTGGHPFLTQRLCRAVAAESAVTQSTDIDRICSALFFTRTARESDDNLLFVRERLLRSEGDVAGLLELYAKVRRGQRVQADETNPQINILRLSGVTAATRGILNVRNRIYERVFDLKWVKENTPDAEWRRQRSAYRRGVIRAAMLSALILLAIGWFAFRANSEAEARRLLLYDSQMRLAWQDYETSANVDRIEELLNAVAPPSASGSDLRGFEWGVLWNLTHREIWRQREAEQIAAATFHADGKTFVYAVRHIREGRNEIKLFDVTKREVFRAFPLSVGEAFKPVAFSPDGWQVAADNEAHGVELWDVRTGQQLAVFTGHEKPISTLAFAPDGRFVISRDTDGVVKLWNLTTRREQWTMKHSGWIRKFAFSTDGRQLLATRDSSPMAARWDVATRKELTPCGKTDVPLSHAAFFPDGKRVLTAGRDETLRIYELPTNREIATLPGHTGFVESIAFSPDGQMFATCSDDHTVKLWDTESARALATIKGHGAAVSTLAWSQDNKLLLTGSDDRNLKLWKIPIPPNLKLPPETINAYRATAVQTNGEVLALGYTQEKQAKLWNLTTGQELQHFVNPSSQLMSAAFAPGQTCIGLGWWDGSITLWDRKTQQSKSMKAHPAFVYALEFSPDGKWLVSSSGEHVIRLWDVASGAAIATLGSEQVPLSYRAVFAPDSQTLATASKTGQIKLWDIATRHDIRTLTGHQGTVRAIAFSPDGQQLATASTDNTVRLWDVATGRQINILGREDNLQRVAFSPDGKRLVTGGVAGTIKIWDLVSQQELLVLKGHNAEITSLTFAADGSLITSDGAGVVQLWVATIKKS